MFYLKHIKPVFQAKCGKCHRKRTQRWARSVSMNGLHAGGETGDELLTAVLEDNAAMASNRTGGNATRG